MDVQTAILTRTATRTFDPGHTMSDHDKRHILELAMRAPSAWNI